MGQPGPSFGVTAELLEVYEARAGWDPCRGHGSPNRAKRPTALADYSAQ